MKDYSISSGEEVHVGLCPDDFEQGDRIYWISERVNLHFGTITESTPQKITVLPDDSNLHFTIDLTSSKSLDGILTGYGKPLDLSRVQRNSVISYKPNPKGKRVYVRVTEHIPRKSVTGFYIQDNLAPFSAIDGNSISMEEQLAFWQLED